MLKKIGNALLAVVALAVVAWVIFGLDVVQADRDFNRARGAVAGK